MALATMDLGIACENPKCKHAVRVIVVTTLAKASPPVSLESALQAAAVAIGMVRVHTPGAKPRILCAACRGRTICRACGIERTEDPNRGPFLCASPSFEVDRVIEEIKEP